MKQKLNLEKLKACNYISKRAISQLRFSFSYLLKKEVLWLCWILEQAWLQ